MKVQEVYNLKNREPSLSPIRKQKNPKFNSGYASYSSLPANLRKYHTLRTPWFCGRKIRKGRSWINVEEFVWELMIVSRDNFYT